MITTKRPHFKQTVGAQYICFATGIDPLVYDSDVEKSETVKNISTTENTESSKVYASGKVYATSNQTSDIEVSTEVIAFVVATLAKMKGESVGAGGLVKSGNGERPFFAYGKTVILSDGVVRLEWFPKCQLTANTDDVSTSEGSFSEQTDTLTISAMPYDDKNIKTYVQSDMEEFPEGLTEDKFFAKPILTDADLVAAAGGEGA